MQPRAPTKTATQEHNNARQSAPFEPAFYQPKLLETGVLFSVAARSGHTKNTCQLNWNAHVLRITLSQCLDSQTLTTLGATGVDHSATATGLHADQKAMGTCAADFGWLVSAFHLEFLANSIQIQLH